MKATRPCLGTATWSSIGMANRSIFHSMREQVFFFFSFFHFFWPSFVFGLTIYVGLFVFQLRWRFLWLKSSPFFFPFHFWGVFAGSGFVSHDLYLHGYFSASIKLPSDYTAGVVVAFYVSIFASIRWLYESDTPFFFFMSHFKKTQSPIVITSIRICVFNKDFSFTSITQLFLSFFTIFYFVYFKSLPVYFN